MKVNNQWKTFVIKIYIIFLEIDNKEYYLGFTVERFPNSVDWEDLQ